ncbi:hypothetical protein TanjilG_07543 [Lupinus angustifolius]|uniref:DUF7054 domain-containing protein n=1 Tax=Lupinus angustifolius TaxID=3871 RepID=A0A1J7IYY4_LUPAN|nr:PREDICTED: uncharacterized protein At4g22758-like [Lupinus angustifolius]OIW18052.1 hypothetical protein TanjilG_07543 [Lupinus angustifolius]
MGLSKQKKNRNVNSNRFLIRINVLGSAGPIRFVVNETELVTEVIDTTLKLYAREGRLPILGNDINGFYLYSTHVESDALIPWDAIGSHGVRDFMLCKKPQSSTPTSENGTSSLSRRGSWSLRGWLNKSLKLKISSH